VKSDQVILTCIQLPSWKISLFQVERSFEVHGQSFPSAQTVDGGKPKTELLDGRSSEGGSELPSHHGSVADDMMGRMVTINKSLVQQIDALRLRLEIDHKHNQEQRATIEREKGTKLEQKSKELSNLKTIVEEKTETLTTLTKNTDKKSKEIDDLQRQIDDLKLGVGDTKIYADQLVAEVSELQKNNGKLQTGSAYHEKEEEIRGLHREMEFMRKNLLRFEKELTKAKTMISQQGGRIRLMEKENTNILVKFREEMNKISANMRLDIGKLREVMRCQWREMRDLREQNETMSKDIREIKELLVEQNKTKQVKSSREQSPKRSSQAPSRSPNHMISMAFKPTFPTRSKDKHSSPAKKNV